MKVSNEVKIGALTIISVTLLILSYNFLKGKSVFKHGNYIYAAFPNAKGIVQSDVVTINGLQIGNVTEIVASNLDIDSVVMTIKLNEEYRIPDNSVAAIRTSPLGNSVIEIMKGTATTYLHSGDVIRTTDNAGLLGSLESKIEPLADDLHKTLTSVDTMLKNVNSILDPNTKGNLQDIILHLSKTTASLVVASASMQQMLNNQTGSLALTLNNANKFSKNLADNNDQITATLTNLQRTTSQLANSNFDSIANNLKKSSDQLSLTLSKVNSTDGSLGALINDKKLYNNLNSTIRSANILMDDFRVHPKRYVSISVFGKKDKSTPLMAPLDTTVAK